MLNAENQKQVVNVDYFLPAEPKLPIIDEHFPDRLHAFVWRNWETTSLDRMALVVGTTPDRILEIGRSMGLPEVDQCSEEFSTRGYATILRRNWHLLPYDQLLVLLGWSQEKLEFHLKEDDFLYIKLGNLKPICEPLKYTAPNEAAKQKCAKIKAVVASVFGDELSTPGEARFEFIKNLANADETKPAATPPDGADEQIRFIYSYIAPYGDPLLNVALDPFPDGLLQRLSESGVNGVWLHVVLRQLSPPTELFPEFGADHEIRLQNLRHMVERAKRYGVKVYLYISEPRAMPESFFQGREHIKGVPLRDFHAICTSVPEVRQWVTDSLAYVFREVPDLGGVFTISKCENPTNCYSDCLDTKAEKCPRCSQRSGPEVIAEINTAIAQGVWQGNPDAKVICWDWMWPQQWIEPIISRLPKGAYYMTVSEWGTPIVRGGLKTIINEYSISAVGPSDRAKRRLTLAKQHGLKTSVKVQVNVTWEFSTLPYLPVMKLIAEHCASLTKESVDSLMLSWSLGGSYSPNLKLVKLFNQHPQLTTEEALTMVAEEYYGARASQYALEAWSRFSEAFEQYPYGRTVLYLSPIHLGPANLLYPTPTGYHATQTCYAYDDVEAWSVYHPEGVFLQQFTKLASMWQAGLQVFGRVLENAQTPEQKENARTDLRIAEVAYIHFSSVVNQTCFTQARNDLLDQGLTTQERQKRIAVIRETAHDEIGLTKRLYSLVKEDSRIGFEACNHYFYLPIDLVEKVVNCRHILDHWLQEVERNGDKMKFHGRKPLQKAKV